MPSSACSSSARLPLAPAAGILRMPPLGTRAGLVVEDVSALRPRAPLESVGVDSAQLPDYLPRQIPFEQTILPNHLCPENTPTTRDEAQPTMRPTGVSVKVGYFLLTRLSVHGPLRDLSHKLREPAQTREIFLSYRSASRWRQQEVSCLRTLEGIALVRFLAPDGRIGRPALARASSVRALPLTARIRRCPPYVCVGCSPKPPPLWHWCFQRMSATLHQQPRGSPAR